jgi:eukaryotic-like serine/threonine-protein kinase
VASGDNRIGEVVGKSFLVEALLASGAMGTVYRGRAISGGRPVAVKFLRAEQITKNLEKRFEREARALTQLRHPHVIEIIAVGTHDGDPFLVTELLHGTSLESVLVETRLAPERALRFADQILSGLGFAHAQGIIHRDVKPENVFLANAEEGVRAKLLDFGLVKFGARSNAEQSSVLTVEGTLLGSPAYMSPEQGFGEEATERSDVYSAGIVLFELLTGSWPFIAEEVADLIRAHAISPVPALGDVRPELVARPELEAVVQRALAKKPKDRFADANEMQRALRAVPSPGARLS